MIKKNAFITQGYTCSYKKLLNDIWLGLKKNKDASYKPINVTEDELNNYIEKLPITHYCHCCRKRNLYQKYRNTIKKTKKLLLH